MNIINGQKLLVSGQRFKVIGVWWLSGKVVSYELIRILVDPVPQDVIEVPLSKMDELIKLKKVKFL